MVFSELFFVFFFFVLCTSCLFFAKSVKRQNIVLLAFSLIFYAWGGPMLILLLAGMTLICYLGARVIDSFEDRFYKKLGLLMTVAICLILLGFFKYSTFIAVTLQGIFGFGGVMPNIVLPIGISFYTFQLLSYVVDVFRGQVKAQKKYWILLLYASLFHQCVAGPIVRYQTVCDELESRSITVPDLSSGITRFSVGLAKKAVLANTAGAMVAELWSESSIPSASALTVFLGGVFYMLQIYLDFSAYSDMAIGMGKMAGFHYDENFNYPYTATSVTDFWRRWHMSLSSFFRDYVYIPLGGNRCSVPRQIFNLFVVWGLTGLWHGASWNYVLWGLYYFVFLVLEKFLFKPKKECSFPISCLRRIPVLVIVYFGWMLFYFEDLSMLGKALGGLFGANGWSDFYAVSSLKGNLFFLMVAILACAPIFPLLKRLFLPPEKAPSKGIEALCGVTGTILPVALLFLALIFLVGNTYNPFLYFQF
ncbi:MAG: MBOAT family protein [Clostridia bacterium]|nr:MBOAT family protein [Clostridia bacterium]